jgi:hypothetical protein
MSEREPRLQTAQVRREVKQLRERIGNCDCGVDSEPCHNCIKSQRKIEYLVSLLEEFGNPYFI